MKRGVSGAALFVLAASALAQAPGAHLSLEYRLRLHAKRIAGPGALLAAAAGAGLNQWRDNPHGWGQGGAGYGRRYGYFIAANAVNQGIAFGAGAVLKEDLRNFPSGEKGFWPRAWSAIEHTFIVPKGGGGETVAYSRLIGAYGAGFLSNTWYPASASNTGQAMLRGSIVLGGNVGSSLFREFWPDLRKRLFGKP